MPTPPQPHSVVYGEYDIIAKVDVANLQALEEFLTKNMRKVPSVFFNIDDGNRPRVQGKKPTH